MQAQSGLISKCGSIWLQVLIRDLCPIAAPHGLLTGRWDVKVYCCGSIQARRQSCSSIHSVKAAVASWRRHSVEARPLPGWRLHFEGHCTEEPTLRQQCPVVGPYCHDGPISVTAGGCTKEVVCCGMVQSIRVTGGPGGCSSNNCCINRIIRLVLQGLSTTQALRWCYKCMSRTSNPRGVVNNNTRPHI